MTFAVLASSRRNYNPLHLWAGGRPLLQVFRNTLEELFGENLLVTPETDATYPDGYRHVTDRKEGHGCLSGIHGALHASAFGRCFVLGADMPFASEKLVGFFLQLAPHFDIVFTDVDGNREPCFAIYSKRCLPLIERLMEEGEHNASSLFERAQAYDGLQTRRVTREEIEIVDPDCYSLINLNTREAVFNMNRFLPGGSELDIKPEAPGVVS